MSNEHQDTGLFNETTGTAVNRGCFVVYDSTDTSEVTKVKLPAAAMATRVAGLIDAVTVDGGQLCKFIKKGRQFAKSDGSGAIVPGDRLVIADTQGRVKKVPVTTHTNPFDVVGVAVQYCAATANALFAIDINVTTDHTS